MKKPKLASQHLFKKLPKESFGKLIQSSSLRVVDSCNCALLPTEPSQTDRQPALTQHILPLHFYMLQQKCGLAFNVDACCESNGCDSLCNVHYSGTKSFTESQVAGHHVWLDAPLEQLTSFVMHYLHCKQQSSHDTSACILVPHYLISQLSARGMLVGMQLLHYFLTGSSLYPGDTDRIPWDANVYFDPPRAQLNALLHDSREDHMQCDASLAGVPVQVLFDTGASECFTNAGFARRI